VEGMSKTVDRFNVLPMVKRLTAKEK